MWIIPRTSRFCRFAPGTAVSNSDWPAHWRTLLESLQWRSKPTPWRTWLLRLRRVNWLSRLCGRTCEPSRRKDFEDALISSLLATRASRSVAPASGKEQTTPDTFGRILRELSRRSDLFGVSSRTSPDTLASDSPMFIAAYEIWVTQLRQDCLARRSAVRPIGGSDCSYWQAVKTPTGGDTCRSGKRKGELLLTGQVREWPTPNVPNRGKELDKSHRPQAGGIDLQSAVWPTPQASEYKGMSQRGLFSPKDRLTNLVGLLDLGSLSTNGKHRERFHTPRSSDYKGFLKKGKGKENLMSQVGRLNPAWVEQLQGLPVGWTDLGSWATG